MKPLIILDWDDTLFPTTWLEQTDLTAESTPAKFANLDRALGRFLRRATALGTVIIITNASMDHVAKTSLLLPRTHATLSTRIRVVSARDTYEPQGLKMMEWKRRTFRTEFLSYVDIHQKTTTPVNVISIGDGKYEYQAMISLRSPDPGPDVDRILKSVKLVDDPTYTSVIDQINILSQSLDAICASREDMDIQFGNPAPCVRGGSRKRKRTGPPTEPGPGKRFRWGKN